MAHLVEHFPTDPLAWSSSLQAVTLCTEARHLTATALGWRVPPICHLWYMWICGLVSDLLFSVDFLWALWFHPTAIRQTVKGLWDWIRQGSSALESIMRWRLSAIKVWIGLDWVDLEAVSFVTKNFILQVFSTNLQIYQNVTFPYTSHYKAIFPISTITTRKLLAFLMHIVWIFYIRIQV